jgi:hypothetical protein
VHDASPVDVLRRARDLGHQSGGVAGIGSEVLCVPLEVPPANEVGHEVKAALIGIKVENPEQPGVLQVGGEGSLRWTTFGLGLIVKSRSVG